MVIALLMSACGGSGNHDKAVESTDASANTPTAEPVGTDLERFNPANFDSSSITIDNRYFPLTPGTQLVYEGFDTRDEERVPHREVFTVTDLVKTVDGVNTVVIWDRDFVRNDLEEGELTFFGQDKNGNVWHFGQYREEYDGADFVGGQAWLAGHVKGAAPGVMMHASPKLNAPDYSEGFAPAPFFWDDRARVVQIGARVEVKAGSYNGIIVTHEYSSQERGAYQTKYYAPGVGFVKVGWGGTDATQEDLALVSVSHLTGADLDRVRNEALALDQRAGMYGGAPAAHTR